MRKFISRLSTNKQLLKGDLYKDYQRIESQGKEKYGEFAISYKDWDITIAAGKNPIQQTKKYWRYIAAARANEEEPLDYIDWIYQEDSKLAKASGEKDFQ